MRTKHNNTTGYAHSRTIVNRTASMISDTLPWKLISSLFKDRTVALSPISNSSDIVEQSLTKIKESNYELYNKILELDQSTQQVLCLRYGLFEGQKKTIDQISTLMGISPQDVRTILTKGLFTFRQSNP
jgi:DNA-directed RNA polymerase sigma subunit (sigma70/sigma32)